MFEGFATARIEANGVGLHLVHGGSGPAVPLLHGYPQTHSEYSPSVSVTTGGTHP